MGTPWYHSPTPTTQGSIATTPSPWNKPWGFPLWARFTGFPAPGTMTRTNQATATSSHYTTTSVLIATTPTTHPLNASGPTTYATIDCVALFHRTTRTLVLVAPPTPAIISSTLYLMTTTPGSWRMWTLTREATRVKPDAGKHQSREGVMSLLLCTDLFFFLVLPLSVTTIVPISDYCLSTHAH